MTRTFCSLCALSLVLLSACTAAPRSAPRTCFHDNEAFETEVGYCQAVRTGQTLYLSGHAAKGEMPAAIQTVYGNLKKTLEANGLTFGNVVLGPGATLVYASTRA